MKTLKKKVKKKSKSKATFSSQFGGLKKHVLKIQPINVFALKIEYLEEGASPTPVLPAF